MALAVQAACLQHSHIGITKADSLLVTLSRNASSILASTSFHISCSSSSRMLHWVTRSKEPVNVSTCNTSSCSSSIIIAGFLACRASLEISSFLCFFSRSQRFATSPTATRKYAALQSSRLCPSCVQPPSRLPPSRPTLMAWLWPSTPPWFRSLGAHQRSRSEHDHIATVRQDCHDSRHPRLAARPALGLRPSVSTSVE